MTPARSIRTGTRDVLAMEIVQHIEHAANLAIAARGTFSLAIPGGSVADAVLPLLGKARISWSDVHVFWTDERAVAENDADSNAGTAARMLANSPLMRHAHLHPMSGTATDLQRGAEAYTIALTEVAGTPPRLDFVLLGVGADGHVASLFPESDELEVQDGAVLVVRNAPKPPPVRLTLSLPVLINARETIVAAFGSSKFHAMHQALEDNDAATPVARILRNAANVSVMLEDANVLS